MFYWQVKPEHSPGPPGNTQESMVTPQSAGSRTTEPLNDIPLGLTRGSDLQRTSPPSRSTDQIISPAKAQRGYIQPTLRSVDCEVRSKLPKP